MAECVQTQSQTIRTSSDGGRISMSYQQARRDWDIPRQGGPEVPGGSRAPSSDGFSRRSLLHPQQEYLGYGHPQQFHEPHKQFHEPFPLHYQGNGPLPEQFQGEKFQPQYTGYGLMQDHYAASNKFQQQFPGYSSFRNSSRTRGTICSSITRFPGMVASSYGGTVTPGSFPVGRPAAPTTGCGTAVRLPGTG